MPFFVVGSERSGTTLLRLMLDHHPDISVAHEFDFSVSMVSEAGDWPDLAAYHEFLARDGSFQRSGLVVDPSLDYPALMASFLEQGRKGAPVFGMTVHGAFHRLLRIWPEARFVHLVRDPRAVAASVIAMGWAGNGWTAVEGWIEAERAWEVVSERVPAERRTEIRYEDLVRVPSQALEQVCALLRVPYCDEMLAYPVDTRYQAPDPARVENWRDRLSRADQRRAEARVGPLLTSRGYEPTGHPPLRVGSLRGAWLRMASRAARFRFRATRYGFAPVLAEVLGRRLGLDSLQDWADRRIRRIHARYIQ